VKASEYVARLKARGGLARLRPGSDPLRLDLGVNELAGAHARLAEIVERTLEHSNQHGTELPRPMDVPEGLVRPL
jgi:hypothetical protein